MDTSRITLPTVDSFTPSQRKVYESIISGPRGRLVGPLRAVLVSPELADRWQRLGEEIRFNTSLPISVQELSIIITARHWNCPVEWQIHSRVALEAGVSLDIIEAIGHLRLPDSLDEKQRCVYEFTRTLLSDGDVAERVHRQVKDWFGEVGVVELTSAIGYYSMVAMMLNAQAVPALDEAGKGISNTLSAGRVTPVPPLTADGADGSGV